MATGLSVNSVVNVAVNVAPTAAARRSFGSLLIAGATDEIDTAERIRLYTGLDAIGVDFGTAAPEYLAAELYFSQSPQPAQVYIARWAKTATAGLLKGAILTATQQALSTFTAITAGSMSVTIDGTARALSSVNLSSATNLNGVASAITTALSTYGTCQWDAAQQRFVIRSATTGASSTVTTPTSTALSIALGFASGATSVAGIAAETPAACAATLADMSTLWYGLLFADAAITDVQHQAVAAFIEGGTLSRVYGVTSQDTAALDSASTTDLASVLKGLGYKRTFVQYSGSSPYAAASIFGRAFTVDFTGSNTTLTLKFKQEPGVTAETLTETQAAALKAKNCNVFVNYNNDTAIIQEGVMANGFFFDEVHGEDWFANAVQTDVFNLLYTSTTKIPQTDPGIHLIATTIEKTCGQAVANGLAAPGTWNAAGFGTLGQGDYLPTGFYVYPTPIAQQAQADREARKAPTIQVALKLAGAVHSAGIIVNVNR